MPDERAVQIAVKLMQLGVSRAGIDELLQHPYDVIEQQLAFLPYRKARRPDGRDR